ncbi:MAG: M1 family aminopeptidase [Flavobacteriales bacterium]|jgi:aminopeptidase N|nr:M1 family aminopeptidase [Flavobacteriales bacterium]
MVRNIILLSLLSISLAYAQKNTCQEFKSPASFPLSSLESIGNNSRSDTFDITNYTIRLDLMEGNQDILKANTKISFKSLMNAQNSIRFDLKNLTVDSVFFGSQIASFSQGGENIQVDFPSTMDAQDSAKITLFYHGTPVVDGSGFGGFDFDGNYWYNLGVAFQFQPHTFGRGWFPCFDNFVERSTYNFQIKSPKNFKAYANGIKIQEQVYNDSIRVTEWETQTEFPTYLASVAAAPYIEIQDTFTSITGRKVPVQLSCLLSDSMNLVNSFEHLQNAFDAFEAKFGSYRWERIGYSATPVGAMEHPGNIAYPKNLINGNLQGESIMAHELAHHWFGNLMTCHRAEEMWINEGWAEYLSFYFEEAVYGKEKYLEVIRNNHLNMLKTAHIIDNGYQILAEMPQNVTYGRHTYNKGADVIHTLRSYMGDNLFFSAHKNLLDQYAFNDIQSTEFRDYLKNKGFTDADSYFDAFIFQKGWAQFDFGKWQISAQGSQWKTNFSLVQNLKEASNLYQNVPLTITFYDQNGQEEKHQVKASGLETDFSFVSSIKPYFASINEDDKISLASFHYVDWIKNTGSKSYSAIDARIKTTQIADSTRFYIRQNWVKPAGNYHEDRFIISPDRYYNIQLLHSNGFEGELELKYNGNSENTKDYGLMQYNTTNQYDENQICVLYRENGEKDWKLYPDFELQTGSLWSKSGKVKIKNLKSGAYVLAFNKWPIGLEEFKAQDWTISPNPSNGQIEIFSHKALDSLSLYDLNGKLIMSFAKMDANSQKNIDLSALANGMYWLKAQKGNHIISKKIVLNR